MKKSILKCLLAFLLVFISLALFQSGLAHGDELGDSMDAVFVFPSSLEVIEDEAFVGTSAKTAVFSSGFLYIGERVFADAAFLTDVYIPSSTFFIGEHAFAENAGIVIHGVKDSYAQKWATEHSIPFVSDYLLFIIDREKTAVAQEYSITQIIQIINPLKTINANKRKIYEGKSLRPQDRPELNPIDYRFP